MKFQLVLELECCICSLNRHFHGKDLTEGVDFYVVHEEPTSGARKEGRKLYRAGRRHGIGCRATIVVPFAMLQADARLPESFIYELIVALHRLRQLESWPFWLLYEAISPKFLIGEAGGPSLQKQ